MQQTEAFKELGDIFRTHWYFIFVYIWWVATTFLYFQKGKDQLSQERASFNWVAYLLVVGALAGLFYVNEAAFRCLFKGAWTILAAPFILAAEVVGAIFSECLKVGRPPSGFSLGALIWGLICFAIFLVLAVIGLIGVLFGLLVGWLWGLFTQFFTSPHSIPFLALFFYPTASFTLKGGAVAVKRGSEWLLIEFFSLVSKKRREEIKTLRAAKRQEKDEARKIKAALRREKEVLEMERKSVPKLPMRLEVERITEDIRHLQTLQDKGHLIKYIGDFRDRFIAKGQVKTYKEVEKVIRAKTEVERALEDLAFATEGRYTSQERAQAKYLLGTLHAQDDIKQQQSLSDTRLAVEKADLEARIAEANAKRAEAEAKIRTSQAITGRQEQKKVESEAEKALSKVKNKIRTYGEQVKAAAEITEQEKGKFDKLAREGKITEEQAEEYKRNLDRKLQRFISEL